MITTAHPLFTHIDVTCQVSLGFGVDDVIEVFFVVLSGWRWGWVKVW